MAKEQLYVVHEIPEEPLEGYALRERHALVTFRRIDERTGQAIRDLLYNIKIKQASPEDLIKKLNKIQGKLELHSVPKESIGGNSLAVGRVIKKPPLGSVFIKKIKQNKETEQK